MQGERNGPIIFLLLLISQFILSSTMMFYKKAFLEFLPYPFFVSFTSGLLLVPVSFLVAWSSHGFPNSISFLRPPRDAIRWLVGSGVLHAVSVIVVNIGFFASDLDFVLLMRLTTLVWHSLFGYVFLGERLSSLGMFAFSMVAVGIVLVVYDFEWSVSKMPSKIQILVQMTSNMLMSVGGLVTKKIMNVINQTETNFKVLDYLVLTSLMSLPTTFLVSLWKEPKAWGHLQEIFTWKFVGWSVFGTVVHEFLHLVLAELHKRASLISMGIIGQLRIVGTLAVSYFVHHQTTWDFHKLVGVGLLVSGGVIYITTPSKSDQRPGRRDDDEHALLESTRGEFGDVKERL